MALPRPTVRDYLYLGLGLGLIARVLCLPCPPIFDVRQYAAWGYDTASMGLVKTYGGIYFPFQYWSFAATAKLAIWTTVSFPLVLKLINLGCEILTLALLLDLLRSLRASPLLALCFWLNPFVLVAFSMGYADPQFMTILLVSVWVLLRPSFRFSQVLAGIPFAVAFFMKPQMCGVVLAVAIMLAYWSGHHFLRLRRTHASVGSCLYTAVQPWSFFLPSGIAFVGLSLYLDEHGITQLTDSILFIPRVMPVLTAHMPNIWFPIAYSLRATDTTSLLDISDNLKLFDWISLRQVALEFTLSVMVIFAFRSVVALRCTANEALARGCMLATLLFPLCLTSAHENHDYVAAALLIPVVAALPGRLTALYLAIFGLLALNLLGCYGPAWMTHWYTLPAQLALSLPAIVVQVAFVAYLMALAPVLAPPMPATHAPAPAPPTVETLA